MSNLKRILYPLLDTPFRRFGRPLTRDKTDAGEELEVYNRSQLDAVHAALRNSPFHRHTWLSTLKYIKLDGQKHYEISSWVYWPEGFNSEWQTHVYVIPVGDVVKVYAHYEKSIFRPSEHQNAAFQESGDPQNHVDFLP